jgi:1,4-alpha-glucan branching enzyme
LTFLRLPQGGAPILVVCNFTPIPRPNYIVGVPDGGYWREIANSDATLYGGSGVGNLGGVEAAPVAVHGHYHCLVLTLPPLAILMFKREVTDD